MGWWELRGRMREMLLLWLFLALSRKNSYNRDEGMRA